MKETNLRIYSDADGASCGLAPQQPIPERRFFGREEELRLCKAAFGLDGENRISEKLRALHFRLEGPPGVGKNEIVYEIARHMARAQQIPFYSIQGHEEMTPEDLSILVVPEVKGAGELPLGLRASPLATAIVEGGLFFFDEINRVPDRALSPLASVLDDRCTLYSAMTGITLRPRDEAARARFRFCCAMNPDLGKAGQGSLPDYIAERTLPAIQVDYLGQDDLKEIVRLNITTDEEMLEAFDTWYREKVRRALSARQAMAIVTWALNSRRINESALEAISRTEKNIRKPEANA